MIVRDTYKVKPRFEAIAVYEGEVLCTNRDLISNHAYCWSRMSVEDISGKTGIESRCYSELSLEDMALLAVRAALTKSGREALGDRRRLVLQLHQHHAHPVRGYMVVGRAWDCARPIILATSSQPAPACPTASPRQYACCRK